MPKPQTQKNPQNQTAHAAQQDRQPRQVNDLQENVLPIRRALVSLSDKTGLSELAAKLHEAGVEIVSTGSTAKAIRETGVPVTEVQQLTGFPECLDGRVKTLHPTVHAGLLADLRLQEHRNQLEQLQITPFQLLVVNLYPFQETLQAGATDSEILENIDIGGPAMVRGSAKNHANVAVLTSPACYPQLFAALKAGGTTPQFRKALAAEAFAHTAGYDTAVAEWFANTVAKDAADARATSNGEQNDARRHGVQDGQTGGQPSASISFTANLVKPLRYGENSHQAAALYALPGNTGIAQAKQLHGKDMSYNNYVDADAAVRAAFDQPGIAVAIVKHANPCGIATAQEENDDRAAAETRSVDAHGNTALLHAYENALACDPTSAFGGVVACNRRVDGLLARQIANVFTEVVIAPGFTDEALTVLRVKKNVRLLSLGDGFVWSGRELRQVSGGMLVQGSDACFRAATQWTLAAGEPADDATLKDLEFAWRAVRAVKSNAILLASGGASVGIGMGQVNRVDACELAVRRAGGRAAGSVCASDAFFPFADGLEVLTAAGVRAIVQPGGSVRDEEVVAAAVRAGVTMYFTGERHFAH